MQNKTIKKALKIFGVVLVVFSIASAVHVYQIKQGKKPNENTISMARLNMKHAISATDVAKISAWLKQQKGVQAIMYNKEFNNFVFSYAPVEANVQNLVASLNASTPYKVQQFIPTKAQMQTGCPAM